MKYDYAHSIDCHSPKFINLMSRLTRLLELSIRFNVRDIENIPASGGGILLMNHSAIPIDGMLLLVKFLKETGRIIFTIQIKLLRPFFVPATKLYFNRFL